ncbi:MAG: Sir2 family NAD-dependent protein deacetylase [Spirochaetia bacterium]|jgi:NAD-dependent deacetylase|nr:Sir2 family NAD-dependent protein deacetylase [Spirochaetia bacterium]
MDDSVTDKIKKLADMIKKTSRTVFLTGAGFSTESSISDYRSKGGIWGRFRPVTIDEFMASREARIRYWQYKSDFYRQLQKASPNIAHHVLARLYKKGLLECIITQNIDGLHQAAGLPDEAVIELHGSNLRAICTSCGSVVPIGEAHAMIEKGNPAPECGCGGYLKPDTISFGQSLREEVLSEAFMKTTGADLFVAAGSTLIVYPAAALPQLAADNGAFTAVINLSETPFDERCDLLINEKISAVMGKLETILFS